MSQRYKNLVSEHHADKPGPTQEQLDRIAARIEADKLTAANAAAVALQLTPAQVLANRQSSLNAKKQRRAAKANVSVSQWEAQAKTYYSIDPVTFTVTSIAKSPDVSKAETWSCADKIEAEEKVLELLDYKWTDHFERKDRPLADFKWT